MKKKIILILLVGSILTILIYYFNKDTSKVNFLALGDGLSTGMTPYHVEGYDFNDYLVEYLNENNNLENYYKSFNETDETINNLLTKIRMNIESLDKKIKIKQAIKEADLITIAIGMDELNNYASKNNLGSTKIKGYLKKYEELLKIVTNLNDKKKIIVGLYSTNRINQTKINKINDELNKLAQKYKLEFIDIAEITKNLEYFSLPNNYYLNYQGQEFIYLKIKQKLEQSVINAKINYF